jgi:hypothetical protein
LFTSGVRIHGSVDRQCIGRCRLDPTCRIERCAMVESGLRLRKTYVEPPPHEPEADVAGILPERVRRLLQGLERNGCIHPVTPQDPGGLQVLRTWGPRSEIPVDEARDFFEERLTEAGNDQLGRVAEEEDLDLDLPSEFLQALEQVVSRTARRTRRNPLETVVVVGDLETVEQEERTLQAVEATHEQSPESVEHADPQESTAKETLNEDLSVRIDRELANQLGTGVAEATGGSIPLKAWLLNPKAAAKLMGAVAEQATTQAHLRKEISETTKWLVEVVASDKKREALLNHIEELEDALGPQLVHYCEARELSVPERGTPERMALLLRISSETAALQTREKEIAKRSEKLVADQVEIQGERARNRVLAEELPRVISSAREVHVLREQYLTENLRHYLATAVVSLSGAVIGGLGGLLAGLESAVTTLVEKYPRVAISLGAGLLTFALQATFSVGELSVELLALFLVKAALVCALTAIATGIGAGLVARFTGREKL